MKLFFQLLKNFRISGPIDRLSPIYKRLKENFEYLTINESQSPSSDLIRTIKISVNEILELKENFTEVILKLEKKDSTDINDALKQLLAILTHMNSHLEISNNHITKLLLTLYTEEIFVLYYFYITKKNLLKIEYQVYLDTI